MAVAEVQMRSAGMSRPVFFRRAERSRGVDIELFVSTMYSMLLSFSAWMNLSAPGIISPSLMRTPSMSER